MPSLRAVVSEAGALAMPFFRIGERTTARAWTKAGDSPVTEADIAVDGFLKARLTALVPEAGWLSEETADDAARLTCSLVWIVDPIDGTRAFAAGSPEWSVSVALVREGRPVAGIVLAPAEGRLYEATAGGGAACEGTAIAVSARPELGGAHVAGPRPLIERVERGMHARDAAALSLTRLPKVPSLALRMVRVAEGAIDLGLVGGRSHDWDLAGADLILREAGGVLSDAAGRDPVYNRAEPVHHELIAGPPHLHRLAREAMAG